ncbi:LANO_0H09164g1_1 [Lachancea nothofagi CBS 11611]|uniref:LANO_0H09164g1_1 n=1 Tax=Lachancea nothofagi CBS 11611 TaxID=1266666 RepID=A0A1G4KM26_9SACH|nr:LANO_0H09164g1_1 [Lachancea nothofagi CBS 11611]
MEIELPDYDTEQALKAILGSDQSLLDIDQLIHATKTAKVQLEDEITACSVSRADGAKIDERSDLSASFGSLLSEVDGITSLSRDTEATISKLTRDISYLDNAKRNLTQSMTLFQNLQLLSEAYFQCRQLLDCNDFKAMRSPYSLMSGLLEFFKNYKSVEEIGIFMGKISRLQTETLARIKKTYQKLLSSPSLSEADTSESMLKDGACELLETNSGAKAELIDWSVNKLLYEITEIFQVNDEAGSLENLSRRYAYFKKVLNSFNSDFSQFFPKSWDIPIKLTSRFYATTRKDLEILLKRELKDQPSIDLFMGSLQTTLEFEKYMDVKFANRLSNDYGIEKISKSFEPYLVLWIQHQESMMNSKILNYMAEDKLSQSSESLVLPSSADLFRTYRSLLAQTLELIEPGSGRDRMLCELATFFNTWLTTYSKKILQPILITPDVQIENKEEAMLYTLLVLNTADYCSATIRQLEEKLTEYLTEGKDLTQLFDKVQSRYSSLISSAMDILLTLLVSPELAFAWREFENTDWKSVVVEDYSRYTITLKNVLRDDQSIMRKVISRFNREMYSWNFMDKVLELLLSGFLNCILRLLKPKPPFANLNNARVLQLAQVVNIGEQLQLDAECLRQSLNFWADDMADLINGSNASLKRIKKHIEQGFDHLVMFTKLLVVPLEVPETYQENYCAITANNTNILSWCFILALKGLPWDLAEWKLLHSAFKNSSEVGESSILPVFERCRSILVQFEYDLSHVNDATWQRFIHNDLGIKPVPIRSPMPSSAGGSMSPTQRIPSSKINGNIKNLMSNTGFFNRGG